MDEKTKKVMKKATTKVFKGINEQTKLEALHIGSALATMFIMNNSSVEASMLACKHLFTCYEDQLKAGIIKPDGSPTKQPDLSYIG